MKRYLILVLSLFFAGTIAFASTSPIPVLKKNAHDLITQLQKNQPKLKNDPEIISHLVKTYILPLVAQKQMARSVVSRADWNNATPSERQAFVKQFRKLVIRTYSSAFANYTDQTVKFRPLRKAQLKQNYIKVSSEILGSSQPAIPVTYSVQKQNGKWLVTDFSVDGVSMVNSFKSQFASLNKGKNLSDLTTLLKKHNQQS